MKEKIETKLKNGPRGLALMIFLFILVFIIGSGVGLGVGYYLGGKNKKGTAEGIKTTEPTTEQKTEQNQEPTDTSDENAEMTYTVQAGDTLFTIGLKFGIPWTQVAEANNLTEDSVIMEGQVLKIPGGASSTGESKSFEINQAEAEKIQSQVDNGQLSWYLDPVSVAKEEVPTTYSISKNDRFSLKSKSTAESVALVEIIHDTKVYQAKLIQPAKTGANGIWATQSVSRL